MKALKKLGLKKSNTPSTRTSAGGSGIQSTGSSPGSGSKSNVPVYSPSIAASTPVATTAASENSRLTSSGSVPTTPKVDTAPTQQPTAADTAASPSEDPVVQGIEFNKSLLSKW